MRISIEVRLRLAHNHNASIDFSLLKRPCSSYQAVSLQSTSLDKSRLCPDALFLMRVSPSQPCPKQTQTRYDEMLIGLELRWKGRIEGYIGYMVAMLFSRL